MLSHEDNGAITYMDVVGQEMPENNVDSPADQCPAPTPAPASTPVLAPTPVPATEAPVAAPVPATEAPDVGGGGGSCDPAGTLCSGPCSSCCNGSTSGRTKECT